MYLILLFVGIAMLAIAKFGKMGNLIKHRLYKIGYVMIGIYLLILVIGLISLGISPRF